MITQKYLPVQIAGRRLYTPEQKNIGREAVMYMHRCSSQLPSVYQYPHTELLARQ